MSLQSLSDLDRPSASRILLGSGLLLEIGARHRAGHGLLDIQIPPRTSYNSLTHRRIR